MTGCVARLVRSRWSLLFLFVFLAFTGDCRAQAAPLPPALAVVDSGLGDVVRTLLLNSLVGGGRRGGTVYAPGDTASDKVLREAGFPAAPIAGPQRTTCPGSTDRTGAPTAGSVGYIVHIHREAGPAPNMLRLDLTVSCHFIYHSGGRPFAQGCTWELRLVNGRWELARSLDSWET